MKKSKNAKKRSHSNNIVKVKLDWHQYLIMVEQLGEKIRKSKIKFDYIYGPCRGGYIPAVILSHKLNIPVLPAMEDVLFDQYIGKTFLFIDDIIDTGKTIDAFINEVKKTDGTKVYSSSLYKHKKCDFQPDFFVEEATCWVVFPYEKD